MLFCFVKSDAKYGIILLVTIRKLRLLCQLQKYISQSLAGDIRTKYSLPEVIRLFVGNPFGWPAATLHRAQVNQAAVVN